MSLPIVERRPQAKNWLPMEMATCIGMDALRVAIGGEPRNFTVPEICKWLELMQKQKAV